MRLWLVTRSRCGYHGREPNAAALTPAFGHPTLNGNEAVTREMEDVTWPSQP